MRTFAPVIIRGRESEGVKFWGFGKTVYEEILGFMTDPDYGDITDPLSGRDIVVEKITPADAGNQYGKTNIRVKPNVTPITDDKNELETIFNTQKKIVDIYSEPTYEVLEEALQNFLNPPSDESKSNSVPFDTSKSTTPSSTAPTTSVNNVEDAFDELFKS